MTLLRWMVAFGLLAPPLTPRPAPSRAAGAADTFPAVVPNDNRVAGGTRRGDTLEIHLEVRMATWHPEADSGPGIDVAALAEEGHEPRIPGPLLRVPTGTTIVATIANRLADSTIQVHGLVTHPAAQDDSVMLRPGESGRVAFAAGAPGTYLYHVVLGHRLPYQEERETLTGAFVVDPVSGSPPDRIMVMNIWGTPVDSTGYRNALAINGRSWPWTEGFEATVGDSVRWRVINGSIRPHPMHLHGFYFRIDGLGNGIRDETLPLADRPMAVTQTLLPFETMAMTWVPDRPGHWLFHCHIGFHVTPDARLAPALPGSHDQMAHDPRVHMAGLVIGIVVHPGKDVAAAEGRGRRLHLFIQEGARRSRATRGLAYVLQRGAQAPAPDSIGTASSVLVLTRGEPTDIVVLNRLRETAAIHWHGIELGSYSDGVPGWSGDDTRLAPSIAPGDSFVARLLLPRAGTFIYHTHMNDVEQLTSGLYGGLVVLEPGHRFDARRDHLFVLGWDSNAEPIHLLVNGDSLPAPLDLAPGVPHRLRLVNIGVAGRFPVSIFRDTLLATWTALARDGADLPQRLRTTGPARALVDVGETRDFTFVPAPGAYRMVVGDPARPLWSQQLVAHP